MLKIYFITLLLLCYNSGFAQTPQISISQEKVNQNGVIKYVHHVKKGETLYSISKAYNVSIDILTNDNPTIKNGLKDGMIIFIPSKPIVDKQAESNTLATQTKQIQEKGIYKKHTVKWYETLEDIAEKYNVSKDDIIALNNLKTTILTKKQILYIPNSSYISPQLNSQIAENLIAENNANEIIPEQQVIENIQSNTQLIKREPNKEVIDITYILPINGLDSASINYNFMDFYAGSLLALENLKEKGLKLNINLIDQFNFPISDIINLNKLSTTEAIIGPIKKKDVADILRYTKDLNIPIISPMDQSVETLLDSNKVLIQIPSTSSSQITNLVNELNADYQKNIDSSKILLFFENGVQDYKLVDQTKHELAKNGLQYEELSYTILEGRNMLHKITSMLNPNNLNYVIVPSANEAFVNDIVRNLSLVNNNEQGEINLYGLSRWRNFETIEPEYFHKMNLQLSVPYYVDYSNQEIKDFLMRYRALYNNEPSPYSYQGYDITIYLVNLLNQYGKDFINLEKLPDYHLFQSNISLTRERENSGFSNTSTRNIRYNKNFTITLLR